MVKLLYKYRVKHCPDIHPILCFSSKSHGHVAGRVGSTALDFEIGEGRWITEFSTVRMLYNIGIQFFFGLLISQDLDDKGVSYSECEVLHKFICLTKNGFGMMNDALESESI
ncbi:unnamed protein product [Triticum turgidum subsp. durum]|uniref:Uncharacterized protein n=1 Tax=Triticum turgidum subsp. durum TaxID=4567 RepID=A0A9R1BMI0_TRITD|nr:unnamed protein product [Triticum turgidum subsp. durum]